MLLGAIALSALLLAIDTAGLLPVRSIVRGSIDQLDLPDVFLDGVLALLLFAGSLHVDAAALRASLGTIAVLATASVILAAALFAFGIWAVCAASGFPLPLAWCGVLGAILAPTDAVVVDALLRRLPLPASLRAAISGESLFNDGAGVILFTIMLAVAGGAHDALGHGRVAAALLAAGAGGGLIGLACGWVAGQLARLVTEEALHVTLSVALAMGSFRLADAAGVSGPIAVVTAGLMLGRMVPAFSAHREPASPVFGFWTLLDGTLNTMLFLLLGLEMLEIASGRVRLGPVLAAIPIALAARWASVGLPLLLRGIVTGRRPRGVLLLTWAGLRGGVSVALALTVPASPYRDQLLAICYAVVVFTIVVQGLTLPWAAQRLAARHPGDQ